MLSTSLEFRNSLSQSSKVEVKATLTLADGEVRELVGDDFTIGGLSFSDAVSSAGSFDIGAAIINQFEFTLNNFDGRFDDYDFTGATVVPYVGIELSSGGVEWLRKGVFGVEQPETYGATIGVTALDNMRNLERPYDGVPTSYPASLRTIVMDICEECGVSLAESDFANCRFVVRERPSDESLTCLAVLAYAAQASGNWARCDTWGRVRLDWYDTSVFEGEDWLDGRLFDGSSPYASGDEADGGGFEDYGSGDDADGGSFGPRAFAHVFAHSSVSVTTDDVVVTGLRVTAQDKEQEEGDDLEGETALYGGEGYVLEIADNPLVQHGTASEVAEQVGLRVVGMRFRPFDSSALGDPAVEAGDPVVITDARQNQYLSYITSLTYKVGSYEAYACNAETPARKKASSYSATTAAIVKLRNSLSKEKSARQRAVDDLAKRLAESSGLHMTAEAQPDGSTVYYMHDKPTLAESQIVWKLTAEALGISTDGGKTYPYGLDVDGDAILNRIYAIGLNADYITSGSLVVQGEDGTTAFSADIDTKRVEISGDCVTLGSERLTEAVNGVRAQYGTCATAGATAEKKVVCEGFSLRSGAVVNVRFANGNTASNPKLNVNATGAKPIYLNGAPLASDCFWSAQDVLAFVFSGDYWYVADSGALSKIKTTADSISLSVSNGVLGSTASIVPSVDGRETEQDIDLTGVREAFGKDKSAVTISAGTVAFVSNTFSVTSTNFSVTKTGVITAKSGTIGGFSIGASSLYKSKSSLTSNTSGVYVGTDGVSVGSGTAYTALAGGYLRGGNSSDITGYVGFNNYWSPSGVYGARMAGRGCIALLTDGAFGIGSYYDYGSYATITTGQTGILRVVSWISEDWSPGLGQAQWRYTDVTFTKGLMTTVL